MELFKGLAKLMAIIFSFMGVFSGIMLMIIGYISSQFMDSVIENNVKTIATITSINSHHDNYNDYDYDNDINFDVFVEYEVNGETYEAELNSYSSDYQIGKKVEIFYNKNDVTQIISADIQDVSKVFNTLKTIGLFITIFCASVLIISYIRSKIKKKKQNYGFINSETNAYAQTTYDKYRKEIINENNNGPINIDSKSSDDGAIKYK